MNWTQGPGGSGKELRLPVSAKVHCSLNNPGCSDVGWDQSCPYFWNWSSMSYITFVFSVLFHQYLWKVYVLKIVQQSLTFVTLQRHWWHPVPAPAWVGRGERPPRTSGDAPGTSAQQLPWFPRPQTPALAWGRQSDSDSCKSAARKGKDRHFPSIWQRELGEAERRSGPFSLGSSRSNVTAGKSSWAQGRINLYFEILCPVLAHRKQ